MIIRTLVNVNYACHVDEKTAKKIIDYAEKNGCSLAIAILSLYGENELPNLYDNASTEDCSTEDVEAVEFEGKEEEYYKKVRHFK